MVIALISVKKPILCLVKLIYVTSAIPLSEYNRKYILYIPHRKQCLLESFVNTLYIRL